MLLSVFYVFFVLWGIMTPHSARNASRVPRTELLRTSTSCRRHVDVDISRHFDQEIGEQRVQIVHTESGCLTAPSGHPMRTRLDQLSECQNMSECQN